MYIKNLTIENYKVYPGRNVVEFTEPNPGSNLNCYLFGGLNGAGKTSLFQAIVLGLYGIYGEGIIFDRSKGENLQRVYERFLEESFAHKALANEESEMRIEVVIKDGKDEIAIGRTWWFRNSGSLEDESIEVHVNGKPLDVSVDEDSLYDVLQEYVESLIPSRLAKFFFFDGEEIKSISERDPSKTVVEGLDALLGFNTLATLVEDLDKILKELQSNVDDSPSKASYLHAMAECDELEDKKKRDEDQLAEVERRIADHEAESVRITDQLNNIFHGSNVQESSEIVDQIAEMEGESRSLTNDVGRFVGDLLYVALPSTLLADTGARLQGEQEGRDWQANKDRFDPERDRVMERLLGDAAPQPEPPLLKHQISFLRKRLKDEWTQMFNPPPAGVPESSLFDSWTLGAMEDALRHLEETKARTRQELMSHLSSRNQIDRKIQKLRQAHRQFQVGPEAQEAIDRKTELAASIAELSIEAQNLRKRTEAFGAEIGNAKAQVARLSETVSQTEVVRKKFETARNLRNAIRDFMDDLRQRRVKELSKRMTEMMTKLAHKDDLVSNISIDPTTYVLKILNSKGEEVQAPSAGEREVFALSMLWGLAQISNRNLPVVIDTPLGRLDQKHRESIVKHYFPHAGDQVIILSTDSEIDQTWYEALKPALVQEFVLEHDDGEEVTTIVSDRYFHFS